MPQSVAHLICVPQVPQMWHKMWHNSIYILSTNFTNGDVNRHLYHGDAGEETANKTIIIMCITSLLFNKCIFTNIDRFHYFILFKRSRIVSFSISARLFPVLSSITSLIISFLFCARSLYIFFISCPSCVL